MSSRSFPQPICDQLITANHQLGWKTERRRRWKNLWLKHIDWMTTSPWHSNFSFFGNKKEGFQYLDILIKLLRVLTDNYNRGISVVYDRTFSTEKCGSTDWLDDLTCIVSRGIDTNRLRTCHKLCSLLYLSYLKCNNT